MFKNNIRPTLFCLFMVFNLSACAIYNTDLDRDIGAKNSTIIAQQMGIYQQPALNQYVQAVGQRLVNELENPEFTFQFQIVDDSIPNAFALPGGYIYISRGLLALMISEDELANVLAHEIIHVTERHSVKQMQSGILPSLFELPGNLVAGIVNENLGNLINAPISAGNDLILSGYGRGQETESDDKGVVLATKAGYQPQQMANILTRLNDAVELTTKQKTQKSYFDSHPYTPDRVENINSVVSKLSLTPKQVISNDFTAQLNGMTYGENPANGFFKGQQFLHPDMGFVIDFPKEWVLQNQPQAVVAFNETKNAFVALTGVNNDKNALQNAQEFQKQVKQETGKTLEYKLVSLDWGGEGYLVSFKDKGQKPVVTINLIWVDLKDTTYQVSSMGSAEFNKQLTSSSLSLRPILESEINSITKQIIKVVKASQSDTLITLAKRNNANVDLEYLALINQINKQQKLTAGQTFKIVTDTPYVSQ
jgi:predicted Zn-dependent protease